VIGGLSPPVMEEIEDAGDRIVVRARTPLVAAACPNCGGSTERVHALHQRTVGDVPIGGRRMQVVVSVRRLVCPTSGCRRTFREHVPGVLQRYQRRTERLQALVDAVASELAWRGAARLLAKLSALRTVYVWTTIEAAEQRFAEFAHDWATDIRRSSGCGLKLGTVHPVPGVPTGDPPEVYKTTRSSR
jgi:transposase